MKPSVKANLIFVFVSAIWGATFPIIKVLVENTSPYFFVTTRFVCATLFLLPFVLGLLKETNRQLLKASLILGILNTSIYVLQTLSLETISPSRCAFMTGSSVAMIPLFSWLFGTSDVKPIDLIAIFICILGLYVLTGANLAHFGIGDLYVFLCAIAYALSVVYLQHLSNQHYSARLLSFYQILFSIPLPFLLCFTQTQMFNLFSSGFWIGIFYCAVLATIVPMLLQVRYQRDSTAIQIGLIFMLEPVFAALFSTLFYHEHLTQALYFGGSLILISTLLPSIVPLLKARNGD